MIDMKDVATAPVPIDANVLGDLPSLNKLDVAAVNAQVKAENIAAGLMPADTKLPTNNFTAKTDQSKKDTELSNIVDSEWLKSTFIIKDTDIVAGDEYKKYIRKNRYYCSADYKFTSTAPGMNLSVNPKPQFTRYADIRSRGKLASRPVVTLGTTGHPYGLGQGRFYSEAFDDNQQRIYFRFGVPKYQFILHWISRSFDLDKVILHNRGVITTTIIDIVSTTTKLFAMAGAPLLALGMVAANVFTDSSRFYSVKSTMYTYWATVENILNQIVARRTMLPHVLQDYSFRLDNKINNEAKINGKFISSLAELLPDVINPDTGRISVFTIALRAQAAFNKMQKQDLERNQNNKLSTDFTGYPKTDNATHDSYFTNNKGDPTLFTETLFKFAYEKLVSGNKDAESGMLDDSGSGATQSSMIEPDPLFTDKLTGKPIQIGADPDSTGKAKEGSKADATSPEEKVRNNAKAKQSTWDKFREYTLAELTEGGAFAVFGVDHTGSVGEAFSNSFSANPIESVFNSMSSKARNMTNILSTATDIPIVGDVMKFAGDLGASILSNASFGIANPLLALAYGVNISMPKIWESSSASLPTATYKMRLMAPYGNPYSQLFNIYLPFSMILAGVCNRGTGASSYMAPYCCQMFDRGRVTVGVGMISQASITRGVSNLGFSRAGHPNAIDVDITVANLDETISVDVDSSGVLSKFKAVIDPSFADTPLNSYLNTVAAVDVFTQIYRVPMIKLKIAERMMILKSIVNPDPAAFAMMTTNYNPLSGLLKAGLGNNQAALQSLINN